MKINATGRTASIPTTSIVILGGGYTGLFTYRSLMKSVGRRVRSGEISITLIDPNDAHAFHGWSGETVAGIISDQNRHSPFRELFSHARIVRGRAISIDTSRRRVEVATGSDNATITVDWDHLVIGTGVRDRSRDIPGLATYGIGLRGQYGSLSGPEHLRQHAIRQVEQAELEWERLAEEGDLVCTQTGTIDYLGIVRREEQIARSLRFVVTGGGFCGVETVAALVDLLTHLRPFYQVLQHRRPEFHLVHAGRSILPELEVNSKKLKEYMERELGRLGVVIHTGRYVTELDCEGAWLDDGDLLESATVVSTVGSELIPIRGTEEMDRDRSGRLLTDAHLNVRGKRNIWAGGDSANVVSSGQTEANSQSAHWAMKHGEMIGKNISRLLTNRKLRPFSYQGLGMAASLGRGKGIVELKGLEFTGRTATLMRILFFLYFVPSPSRRFAALIEWGTLPFRGRKIEAALPSASHQNRHQTGPGWFLTTGNISLDRN